MAQLTIINSQTEKPWQSIGDKVSVHPSGVILSATTYEKFEVLEVGGSVDDVNQKLSEITPRREHCYLWQSDMEYHWTRPIGQAPLGMIEVYQLEGDRKWYQLVNDPKFPVNFGELTQEEKDLIATVDINHPSVDNFIRKLVKDLFSDPENQTEIKELRGTAP